MHERSRISGVGTTAAIAILLLSGVLLPPVALTAVGAGHRGQPWHRAALSGLFFPATWTIWYVRDERPRWASFVATQPTRACAPPQGEAPAVDIRFRR